MSRFYERGKIFNSFHFTGNGDKHEVKNFIARRSTPQFFHTSCAKKERHMSSANSLDFYKRKQLKTGTAFDAE